nr:MAG TPA: hypothetical protein [Caudoviricetes sp.]
MSENNLRANKHFRYILTDYEAVDEFKSNNQISDEKDILMTFNGGYYGPVFLVFDYQNNHVFEYTDEVDNSEWKKMVVVKDLKGAEPLIKLLQRSIFTFDYKINSAGYLGFCLKTYNHGVYTIELNGSNAYTIDYRQSDGRLNSCEVFSFEEIPDTSAFDNALIKLFNFEYEICNDNTGTAIVLKKQNQHFNITYRKNAGFQHCFADLSKNQIYQVVSGQQHHTLEFMLNFKDKKITDLYLKQWVCIMQKCYLSEYDDILLSNLQNNTPFLEWK